MSNLALGEAYLRAWDNKDLSAIASHLHPDVRFLGPMTATSGKEAVVEAAKRMFPLLKSLKIQSKFAARDQAIFTYEFICPEPINVCRTAELMTFKDGLIIAIELFFDARPFEKLAQAQKQKAQPA